MNLLMSVKDINVNMFKKTDKNISSFELLTQIMPNITAKFKNGQPYVGG